MPLPVRIQCQLLIEMPQQLVFVRVNLLKKEQRHQYLLLLWQQNKLLSLPVHLICQPHVTREQNQHPFLTRKNLRTFFIKLLLIHPKPHTD